MTDRLPDLLSEIPARHLPERQLPGIFVGGKIFFTFTYIVCNEKCFVYRELAVMKDSPRCCRFLGLASCTTPRPGGFSLAVIDIPTFPADETVLPFHFCKELITFFITPEQFVQLILCQFLFKYSTHHNNIIKNKITKNGDNKKIQVILLRFNHFFLYLHRK